VNGSVSGGNSDKLCSKIAPRFLQVDLGQDFNVDQFVIKHAGAGGESTTLTHDIATHEICHVVESANNNVHGSPAFGVWGDSFPRANTAWFRDGFFPLWRDRGHAQVMVRFFQLLAQHFPKQVQNHGNGDHQHYTRGMNLGESVHFMSGAAQTNLLEQGRTAFGANTNNWETQFNQARQTFPGITYP
jgi:hypothetical protein